MPRIGYFAPRVLGGALLSALALTANPTFALDFNGQTLPVVPDTHEACSSDVWFCVNDHEDALGYTGEDIDVVETATIDQETFNPLCNLSFEVLFEGASYINVFGWYEAERDADGNPVKPDPSEMHVMLGCDTPVGETVDLPAPDGVTEIGFFLANNKDESCVVNADGTLQDTQENLFFSEPALNDDDGRVHLLIWQSRANPTAFYFGWEDLRGGGDNDFEDLLTFVTGIQCAGGGDLCDTGEEGVCAQGIEQCRDGQLTCVPLQEPHEEECNAVDDDCDGEIDDGDDLCDEGMICYRGTCQPRCGGGEFQCAPPLLCDKGGVCVDAKCLDKECGDGKVCRDGECVGACDGVACPYGQACRAGVCVDVCAGVQCDEGFACEVQYPEGMNGTPIGLCSSCGCTGCADGYSCEQDLCVDDACVDMSCAEGFRCDAGECVDKCKDATCPTGMKCETGSCVVDEDYDPTGAGGEGGATGDTSSTTGFTIGTGATSTSLGSTTSPNGQGGTSGPLETQSSASDSGGCGCRTAGSRSTAPTWWLVLPFALGFARRRREKVRARF